ncbi:MAG: LysE family translocator [Pseudomonadota bacterium]
MDWASLTTFAFAFFLSAAMPGPSNVAVIARSMTTGFWPTVPMLIGLIIGEMLFVGFAVFGLALVATMLGAVFVVIKWAGAAYLCYLAYHLWTAPPVTAAQVSADPVKKRSASGQILLGLALVLGNPKTIAFYLALLPVLIDLKTIDAGGFVLLLGLMVTIYTPVLLFYAYGAARAGQAIRRSGTVRAINRTAAAAMAGAAATIVAKT